MLNADWMVQSSEFYNDTKCMQICCSILHTSPSLSCWVNLRTHLCVQSCCVCIQGFCVIWFYTCGSFIQIVGYICFFLFGEYCCSILHYYQPVTCMILEILSSVFWFNCSCCGIHILVVSIYFVSHIQINLNFSFAFWILNSVIFTGFFSEIELLVHPLVFGVKEALLKGVMCAALRYIYILLDTDNFQKTFCSLCTKALLQWMSETV
jgi:hypothetical protein